MTAKVKHTGRMEAEQVAAAAAAGDAQQQAVAVAGVVLSDAPVTDTVAQNPDDLNHQEQAAVAAAADSAVDVEDDAATVLADAVMPTAPPAAMSIGELAQATTETATDAKAEGGAAASDAAATPDAAVATTEAPAADVAATDAGSAGMSPWLIGGLAVLGVGAIAAAADSGGSSSSTPVAQNPPAAQPPAAQPPAAEPPAAQPPAGSPPVAVDEHAPTGMVAVTTYDKPDTTTPVTGVYLLDTNGNGRVDAGERVVFFSSTASGGTGHYYELVHSSTALNWADASAAADTRGGSLLVIDTDAEAAFVRQAFSYEPTVASTYNNGTQSVDYPDDYDIDPRIPAYGGLPVDQFAGSHGAWVGLTGGTTGYSWANSDGSSTALSNTSALWIVHDNGPASDTPSPEQRGAIVGGNNNTTAAGAATTQILFGMDETSTLNYYVVEYASIQEVNSSMNAPASGINLASVSGGVDSVAPASTDALAAPTGVAHLLDPILGA